DGPWRLLGGTIIGGTLATTGGGVLLATTNGGTLANGVTLNGILDLSAASGTGVSVTGGLTLGGTVLIGSASGNYGVLSFDGGNQTLSGNGTVVFGSSVTNTLRVGTANTTLTIGANILIHGKTGGIGFNPNAGGPSNVAFINQGTIQADVAGGTL